MGVHPQTGRGAVTVNTSACHKGPGHAHTGAHVCTQRRSFQRGTVQHLGPEQPREVGGGGLGLGPIGGDGGRNQIKGQRDDIPFYMGYLPALSDT